MIGKIEKRKKGRPSKADLARRAAAEDGEVRRRLRCRNDEDWDDDDEEEEEERERGRREKKVKVRRVDHAPPLDSDDGDDEVDNEIGEESSAEASVRERKAGSNDADSIPGTPSNFPVGVSLPDKKTLEMVLDKLQKKDTYGVYAEPVDPDELPDYHDVIEHPMDFSTMRRKLGKGSYSTLEQFESDILLICSNAMLYNASDTIYHKQALSIQELAKRKLQRLRSGAEQYEKELESEPKPTSNSFGTNKQIRKPIAPIVPETVASDISSGTVGDLQPGSTTKASASDRPTNMDESVDGTATQSDNNLEKTEDLPSGKGHISRLGRKRLVHDNRRATYNLPFQPVSQPDSMFSTFNGEAKQLVTVGLNADHSYARSLARFAAMLGPVAWNVASKRIEQALPPDFKYGRGWVGDYEPIFRPVLVVQKCSEKETVLSKPESRASANPNNNEMKTAKKIHKNPIVTPNAEGKSILSPRSYSIPSEQQPFSGELLDVKPKIAANVNFQVQNPRAKTVRPEKKVKKKQVQLNSPPSPGGQNPYEFSSANQIPNNTNMPSTKSMELHSRDMNHPVSVPFKPPQNNGFVEMTNEKSPHNNFGIPRTTIPVNTDRNHTSMPANYFPHGHDQALTDPVQLMRRLSENAPNQHKKSIDHLTTDNPLVSSSRKEDPSNASSAAARAWMSIGAGSPKSVPENTNFSNKNQIFVNSLHSPTQVSRFRGDFPVTGMQFHPINNNNNFPIQGFMPPQFRTGNETQFQNHPQMVFPQLVTTDLSRFQMQYSPNQGQHLLQRQPSQKHETTIPPDLNLMFQSSGSPGKSSGFQVDSQQPDLALQL